MLSKAFENSESLKQLLAGSNTKEYNLYVDGSSSVEPKLYRNQYLRASTERTVIKSIGNFEVEIITDVWILLDNTCAACKMII